MILETSVDRCKAQVKFMMKLKFVIQPHFAHWVGAATSRAARPLVRMAALHPRGHTAHAVQLRFLG